MPHWCSHHVDGRVSVWGSSTGWGGGVGWGEVIDEEGDVLSSEPKGSQICIRTQICVRGQSFLGTIGIFFQSSVFKTVSWQQYLLKYIYLNLRNTCLLDCNHLLYVCDDLSVSRIMQMWAAELSWSSSTLALCIQLSNTSRISLFHCTVVVNWLLWSNIIDGH